MEKSFKLLVACLCLRFRTVEEIYIPTNNNRQLFAFDEACGRMQETAAKDWSVLAPHLRLETRSEALNAAILELNAYSTGINDALQGSFRLRVAWPICRRLLELHNPSKKERQALKQLGRYFLEELSSPE